MDTELQHPQAHPLDAIEQRAMMAITQHLEPHDCQWGEYAQAARDVVNAIRPDIAIQTVRQWADRLEASLADRSLDFEEVRPSDLREMADEMQAALDEDRALAASEADRG